MQTSGERTVMAPPATTTTPYQLGDLIPLEDLLAFPPDPRRLTRDARGRLCLMSPENPGEHRLPIGELNEQLHRLKPSSFRILPEASLALPRLLRLDGSDVPLSKLGRPRAIEADLAVFDGTPQIAQATRGAPKSFTTRGLRLVVEVLSEESWNADLGIGQADAVDRWTSHARSGVPELWLVNAGVEEGCPLPPMTGLFLRNAGDAWTPLDVTAPAHGPGEVHGLRPLVGGVVRSTLGFELDVGAFFTDLARAIAEANRVDEPPG